MQNPYAQQIPRRNQWRRRRGRGRVVNYQAVDQHINFTEKFIAEILQNDSSAVTKGASSYRCGVCDIFLPNLPNVESHLAGKRHRHLCLQYGLVKNR